MTIKWEFTKDRVFVLCELEFLRQTTLSACFTGIYWSAIMRQIYREMTSTPMPADVSVVPLFVGPSEFNENSPVRLLLSLPSEHWQTFKQVLLRFNETENLSGQIVPSRRPAVTVCQMPPFRQGCPD